MFVAVFMIGWHKQQECDLFDIIKNDVKFNIGFGIIFLLFFLTYFQLFILMSKKYIIFANHSEIIISS